MTAAASTLTPSRPATLAGSVTAGGIVRSEWTKFRSLRSSWWTLGVAVVLTVGFGALVGAASTADGPDSLASPAEVTSGLLLGVVFAQLATGILGVLLISGEYGTGMIRSSMTAVPKRLPVLWAKAAVYTAVVLPVSMVASFAAFWLGSAIMSGRGLPTVALSDSGVLREVVGSSLYITVAGLLALGIATLLRHTAAGLAAVVGLFFVLPIVAAFLPARISGFAQYLPSNAGGSLWGITMSTDQLAPWTGFALLGGYAVVVLVAAAARLRRTDV